MPSYPGFCSLNLYTMFPYEKHVGSGKQNNKQQLTGLYYWLFMELYRLFHVYLECELWELEKYTCCMERS